MQFVITAYDGEGKLDKRMEVRPRHFDTLFRDYLLIFRGERRLFAESFVSLHPITQKR